MGMTHPCKVCNNVECKYLYDEYWQCPNCKRVFGYIDETIMDDIIKEADKKKVGRAKGSRNKNRLERLGLLKKEEGNDKKTR